MGQIGSTDIAFTLFGEGIFGIQRRLEIPVATCGQVDLMSEQWLAGFELECGRTLLWRWRQLSITTVLRRGAEATRTTRARAETLAERRHRKVFKSKFHAIGGHRTRTRRFTRGWGRASSDG